MAELAGEKIDVIPWSDDASLFVANALSPAQVISVDIDEEHRIASVTVPERMLSLAIGREGQNARLAARLTGWRIDIRSDVSVAEAKAAADAAPEPETPVAASETDAVPAIAAKPKRATRKAAAPADVSAEDEAGTVTQPAATTEPAVAAEPAVAKPVTKLKRAAAAEPVAEPVTKPKRASKKTAVPSGEVAS